MLATFPEVYRCSIYKPFSRARQITTNAFSQEHFRHTLFGRWLWDVRSHILLLVPNLDYEVFELRHCINIHGENEFCRRTSPKELLLVVSRYFQIDYFPYCPCATLAPRQCIARLAKRRAMRYMSSLGFGISFFIALLSPGSIQWTSNKA